MAVVEGHERYYGAPSFVYQAQGLEQDVGKVVHKMGSGFRVLGVDVGKVVHEMLAVSVRCANWCMHLWFFRLLGFCCARLHKYY